MRPLADGANGVAVSLGYSLQQLNGKVNSVDSGFYRAVSLGLT